MADQISYAYVGDIVKQDRTPDGNLMVFGKATGADVDLDGQVADPEWLKEAMPDWAKWGNLREMHQPIVAGIGREVSSDDSGNWFLKSEVLDAGTAKKIEAGALKGYSIGIKNATVMKGLRGKPDRIVGGTIVEVSYVDRPCNPTSTIGIAKAAGADNALEGVENPNPGTAWLQKKFTKTSDAAGDDAVTTASDKVKPSKNDPCCPLCAGTGKFSPKQNKKTKAHAGMKKSADSDLLSRIEVLEKRIQASGKNIDSSGRDVSDLPAGDFAGPDGTFPIKDRDDVHNAASLAHHAADPAAVRAKIRRIARRKFNMTDEELPKSLKKSGKKAKANKSADADKAVKKLVKAAVAEQTADLRKRAEEAEAKLETISKTVVPGGPRPTGFPTNPQDELKAVKTAQLAKYTRLAEAAQDADLRRGYADLAKQVQGDLNKMA
jgi:hypothetical protein